MKSSRHAIERVVSDLAKFIEGAARSNVRWSVYEPVTQNIREIEQALMQDLYGAYLNSAPKMPTRPMVRTTYGATEIPTQPISTENPYEGEEHGRQNR